jgi:hypothetical protein
MSAPTEAEEHRRKIDEPLHESDDVQGPENAANSSVSPTAEATEHVLTSSEGEVVPVITLASSGKDVAEGCQEPNVVSEPNAEKEQGRTQTAETATSSGLHKENDCTLLDKDKMKEEVVSGEIESEPEAIIDGDEALELGSGALVPIVPAIIEPQNGHQQRGRPFVKGHSGNPLGRPKGSRNRTTLAVQAFIEGDVEAILRR